jgi:hypothetical protein
MDTQREEMTPQEDEMTTFTLIHVLISLLAIASGLIVTFGMISSKRLDGWTAVFLGTTVLTSVTGFFFPINGPTPALTLGALSLIVLAVAILARYRYHMVGIWRRTYAITAVVALYFNFFVLIVQAFLHIPALHALAPTQTETPFMLAQLVALLFFATLGKAAVKNFRAEPEQQTAMKKARGV